MKIVIISEYATRELYVIERILEAHPSAVVVRPTYSPSSHNGSTQKVNFQRLINQFTWKLHRELWNRKIYPDKSFPIIANQVHIPATDLHSSVGVEAIKKLSPDILISCRSPLLKPEIIRLAKIAAVNIHYGIAPQYRGNDTLFWPLFYEDYDHIGGCIHHLTEGIDTGNILAEVYPDLNPKDGEIAIDYKTTKLLAIAALRFLKAVENRTAKIEGKPQHTRGRNFNRADRTPPVSLKYLIKRSVGMSRPPKRKGKIIAYF